MMTHKFALVSLLAASCLLPRLQAQPAAGKKPEPAATKYGIEVQPGPMDSILLKDYKPTSSLVVPRTNIEKAKYPAIDDIVWLESLRSSM